MSFFNRNSLRVAVLLGAVGMVSVVIVALALVGDKGLGSDSVMAEMPRAGPTEEYKGPCSANYPVNPTYDWVIINDVLNLKLTTPAAVGVPWDGLDYDSDPNSDKDVQIYYRFYLASNSRYLVAVNTFSPKDTVRFYPVKRTGIRPRNMIYSLELVVYIKSKNLRCKHEASSQTITPSWVKDIIEEPPATRTPTPTAPPPVCSVAPSQQTIDNHHALATPYQDVYGNWQVAVAWEPFQHENGDYANYYLLGIGNSSAGIPVHRPYPNEFVNSIQWNGSIDWNQTYFVTLEYEYDNGHDNCPWGTKKLYFKFNPGDVRCDNSDMEAVAWGYWEESSRKLRPYVTFGLVDWAEYYLVQFDSGQVMKVVPDADAKREGQMSVRGDIAYGPGNIRDQYRVSVVARSKDCVGAPVSVDCGAGVGCPKVAVPTPGPVLPRKCTGYGQPVVTLRKSVNQDGKHDVSFSVESVDADATHFETKFGFGGIVGDPVPRSAIDVLSNYSLGSFDGPVNKGDDWVMTLQARAVNKDVGCDGPWGPFSVVSLTVLPSTPTPGVTPGVTPSVTPGVTPGVTPSVTPGVTPSVTPPPTSTPQILPTPVVPIPGDPVVYPEPEDYWGWKANPESGIKPGHYSWCDKGRYDSKMDDYYARIDEFATTYGQILKDAGVRQVRREVNEAIDEAFEDPEEFCARVGLFGFIRFGLMWLSGAVFSLMAFSGVILIIVRSTGGDSPGTQVWVKQVFVGLLAGMVLVAVVWVVFEILVSVLFGVGVDALQYGTPGGMIAPAGWRGVKGLLSWIQPVSIR